MSDARDKMVSALKEIAVPTLRAMGFRGSFPHFRRQREEQIVRANHLFSIPVRSDCQVIRTSGPGQLNTSLGVTD
jgi:hypothetical protein